MNLSLNNTQNAFAYKSNTDLNKAKWLFTVIQNPWIVSLGTRFTPMLMKSGLPINGIIRNTIFNQFVGGETLDESARVTKMLGSYGVQVILDYGVEAKEGDASFDEVTEQFIAAVEFAATQDNVPFVSVKLTGLSSMHLLERLNDAPRLRSGIHDSESDDAAWNRLKERMHAICEVAARKNIGILIDAEETWIQDPIDRLAIELMGVYNKEKVVVYNTYQLYRSDRLNFLKISHKIAAEGNFILGAKLVRGAYMEKERARAAAKNYEDPIQKNKKETDEDYDAALDYCVANIADISICAGTHNENSSMHLVNLMAQHGIASNDRRVYFSQLLGMSDNLSYNLSEAGYNVAKYVPYGPVKKVLPYLFRRAEENTAIAGQMGRELSLIVAEQKRRKG